MIDGLMNLASLVSKIFSIGTELKKSSDGSVSREIGKDLFILYYHLSRVVTTGDEIVSTLEKFSRSEATGREIKSGSSFEDMKPFISFDELIVDQSNSIRELLKLCESFDRELAGVSPSLRRELNFFAESKRMRFSGLQDAFYGFSTEFVRDAYIPGELRVGNRVEATDKARSIAALYLQEHQPKRYLDQLHEVSCELKEKIEENFSITDILVDIRKGDIRSDHTADR